MLFMRRCLADPAIGGAIALASLGLIVLAAGSGLYEDHRGLAFIAYGIGGTLTFVGVSSSAALIYHNRANLSALPPVLVTATFVSRPDTAPLTYSVWPPTPGNSQVLLSCQALVSGQIVANQLVRRARVRVDLQQSRFWRLSFRTFVSAYLQNADGTLNPEREFEWQSGAQQRIDGRTGSTFASGMVKPVFVPNLKRQCRGQLVITAAVPKGEWRFVLPIVDSRTDEQKRGLGVKARRESKPFTMLNVEWLETRDSKLELRCPDDSTPLLFMPRPGLHEGIRFGKELPIELTDSRMIQNTNPYSRGTGVLWCIACQKEFVFPDSMSVEHAKQLIKTHLRGEENRSAKGPDTGPDTSGSLSV